VNDDLLIALAGGAIGAALAAIGFIALRLSAVPGDVDRHDRRARALDQDLERWVADDHRQLRADMAGVADEHNSRNVFYSGFHLAARGEVKTQALQRYRDRLAETTRAFDDLVGEESWAHDLWRNLRRREPLALQAPGRVEAVIDEWRRDAVVPSIGSAQVYDPTRWTTDDLLRNVRERPLEPPEEEPRPEGTPPTAMA
jgi:hypothetical protein